MIVISSFNNIVLLHSMFADCCMLKLKAGSGAPWRPQDDGDRHDHSRYELACCRNRHLLFLFLIFCRRRHHASFPHDVSSPTMQHNNQFGVEAASPMAPMPVGMLIVTLLGRHCWSPGTLPYIFLRRTQLTTTPQRPSTRHDLNGRQRPPWCPTPSPDAHNGHPVCWLIVVCGGAGSGASWRLWDDGNRQRWQGTL